MAARAVATHRLRPFTSFKAMTCTRNLSGSVAQDASMLSSDSTTTTMMMAEPIHILGAGSIGLLLAASIRLAFPNYPVQLLVRDSDFYRKILLDKDGSRKNKTIDVCLRQIVAAAARDDNKKQQQTGPPRLVPVPAQIIRPPSTQVQRPFRNLVVATKANHAVDAVASVRHCINAASTKLIVVCNGSLAVREQLRMQQVMSDTIHQSQLHLAWTSHGSYREVSQAPQQSQGIDDCDDDDQLFHVVHAGMGQMAIENYPELAQLLDRAGLNAASHSSVDVQRQLWCKLAANCAINPLTALHACRNGALLDIPNIQETIQQVVAEVARVAQAEWNADMTRAADDDLTEAALLTFVRQVILDTANNKSSMLQDVLAGRSTEIDYLNGYIVERGRALGIACPVNERLCQQVAELSTPR